MQITKLGNPSHGDLPGLGDDDHTQYLLVDGSRHADSLIIDGDLTVSGSTVTMDVTNMTVEDNIVVYNKGETASGVTLGTAGLQIDRGLLTDAQLLWNETTDKWQVGTVGSLHQRSTYFQRSFLHNKNSFPYSIELFNIFLIFRIYLAIKLKDIPHTQLL